MYIYCKNTSFLNTPILEVPHELMPDYEGEGFIFGNRIERRTDETWEIIGSGGDPELVEDDTCARVRVATGELIYLPTREEEAGKSWPRDKWMDEDDFTGRIEPLPEGWYRMAGLELTRAELLKLLPQLKPDLVGVVYEGTNPGICHFWNIGGGTGVWNHYALHCHELAVNRSRPGAHVLYRVDYEDPMRPGNGSLPTMHKGFCLGYWRAVPGPQALLPVDLADLAQHWPVEELREVLKPEELALANLATSVGETTK